KGGFKLDMSYFCYHYTRKTGLTKKFTDMFGLSKTEGKDWTDKELNVAAAAQHVVEDVILHMARKLREKTKSENLCIAGGVGLNSVTNGLIAKYEIFKNIFILPAAGDSGTALGSALLYYHQYLNMPDRHRMESAFLGNGYNEAEYEAA